MEADVFLQSSLDIGGKTCTVRLTKDFLFWDSHCFHNVDGYPHQFRNDKCCIKVREIIAINPEQNTGNESREGVEMITFNVSSFSIYVIKRLPKHNWRERKITFRCHDVNVCQLWLCKVREILSSQEYNRPKRLLVFVNPFGGRRKGPKIYTEKVAPLFDLAGVETDVRVTTRANHARELLQEYDLSKIDGIVTVGGDGMFAEVMNGLVVRWNSDRNIDVNDMEYELIPPDIRVGLIPAGSTDTVVYCTTGTGDPVTSALHIIVGDSLAIDVSAVHHDNQLLRYCVSMLGYGFYGDVLRDSESHRWMGPKRYTWSGTKKFLKNKSYEGEVSFLAGPEDGEVLSTPRDGSKCLIGCSVCRTASELQLMSLANADPIRKRNSIATRSTASSIVEEHQWKKIEGRFIGVNAVTISCKTEMSPDGFSPSCHLGDGHVDLVLVRECSRLDYLRHMTRFQKRSKDQFDFNFIQVLRVKEFKFRPIVDDDQDKGANSEGRHKLQSNKSENSVWNCDGEVIEQPAIDVRVHCQLLNLFARGIERDEQGHDDGVSSMSCMACARQ